MAEAHPKGVLLERAQKLGLSRPEFRTERTGPEHEPSFISDAIVDGEVLGTGQGGSKRTAEKNAAQEALAALDDRESTPAAAAPRGRRGAAGKPTAGKPTTAKSAAGTAAGAKAAGGTAAGGKSAGSTSAGAQTPADSPPAGQASRSRGRQERQPTAGGKGRAATPAAAEPAGARTAAHDAPEDTAADEPFTGPWPMFDDLLAAVLGVAERRVSVELRGEAARVAVRDFSLALYKELLADLGEVVEEEEDDEDEDS